MIISLNSNLPGPLPCWEAQTASDSLTQLHSPRNTFTHAPETSPGVKAMQLTSPSLVAAISPPNARRSALSPAPAGGASCSGGIW